MTHHWSYAWIALIAYVAAGTLKFTINSIRARTWAFAQIGLGHFPSTHTSIVVAVASSIGAREGFDTAAFSVASTLALIVIIDALDLRNRLGALTSVVRRIAAHDGEAMKLRARTGHSGLEVAGGCLVGLTLGLAFGHL